MKLYGQSLSALTFCLYNLVYCAPPVEPDQRKLINALSPSKKEINSKDGGDSNILAPPPAIDLPQIEKPAKAVPKMPGVVKRPDHLEAVPLERDGQLNKKFREEIFLGKDTMDLKVDENGESRRHDDTQGKDTATLLREVFVKADKNKDNKLSGEELESQIAENTLHHLDEAVKETKDIFKAIDQNGDDILSWEEYHYHFLVNNKLMDHDVAKNHKESDHKYLSDDDQERIEVDRESWDAADEDGSEGLTEREFLAFRHPEHSNVMLKDMVESILRSLDKNGDGRLTEDEFAAPPPGEVDEQWREQEKKFVDERRKEFKEIIDKDSDGFASLTELEEYSNPRNPQHARQEVKDIMMIADKDEDGHLTLDEMLAQKELLISTGILHPERKMHDEM